MWDHPTVTASTMITQTQSRHKVRCHTVLVEIFGSDRPNSSVGPIAGRLFFFGGLLLVLGTISREALKPLLGL
jgi:hypothetical protein